MITDRRGDILDEKSYIQKNYNILIWFNQLAKKTNIKIYIKVARGKSSFKRNSKDYINLNIIILLYEKKDLQPVEVLTFPSRK